MSICSINIDICVEKDKSYRIKEKARGERKAIGAKVKAATRRGREVGRGRGKSKVMKRKLSREKNVFRRGRLRRSEAEEEGGKRAVQDQSDFTGISRTQKYGVFFCKEIAHLRVLSSIERY